MAISSQSIGKRDDYRNQACKCNSYQMTVRTTSIILQEGSCFSKCSYMRTIEQAVACHYWEENWGVKMAFCLDLQPTIAEKHPVNHCVTWHPKCWLRMNTTSNSFHDIIFITLQKQMSRESIQIFKLLRIYSLQRHRLT